MEPEQRKLPRLLCFYTDTTNNSTTKPAHPAKATKSQATSTTASAAKQSPPTKCQPPQFPHHETTNRRKPHQPHVKAYQNQRTSVAEARRQRKPVRSISHGVVRVPPARIGLWSPRAPRPSLPLLSRGIPGNVYLRHTAALLVRWLGVVSPSCRWL